MPPFRRLNDLELSKLSDEALLDYMRRARLAGERDAAQMALQILAYGHMDEIAARVARRVPREAVEEVASIAFVAAVVAALRTDEIRDSFRAWLFRIVDRRGIADYYRKREREVDTAPLAEEHEADEEIWSQALAAADDTGYVGLVDLIDRIMSELDPIHREVLDLHIFQAFSAPETADQINAAHGANLDPPMSVDNVHQIASRFRKRLRDDLDEGDTSA